MSIDEGGDNELDSLEYVSADDEETFCHKQEQQLALSDPEETPERKLPGPIL